MLYHQTLSNTNNPAITEQLQCPILLCQPLELSCRALVCTDCLVHCFLLFNCSEVKCPCCFMESPIQPQQLKPAPLLIQTLLKDIMVKCVRCKRDVRAGDFDTHECSTLPTKVEVKMASRVLKRLASTSPEQHHSSWETSELLSRFLHFTENASIGGPYNPLGTGMACRIWPPWRTRGRINTCPCPHAKKDLPFYAR